MKDEELLLRMNLLGGMNEFILKNIYDEDYHMYWLRCGVPNSATEDDLKYIAEDNELFADCCRIFGSIVEHSQKELNELKEN